MAKEMHKELIELKFKILEMGKHALSMLEDAVESLDKQDLDLANDVLERKLKIREYDDQIEAEALRLMALFQPMARDLREIATILKMNTYLARIGRYGKDIADVMVKNLSEKPLILKMINLRHIFEHVRDMISDALTAFEQEDISYIKDLSERDDEVDKLRWAIFRECITYMMEDPKYITEAAHYAMFARYLERCGDHACKMAEKIHYMVTGERIEIS